MAKIYISDAITDTDNYIKRFGEAQVILEQSGYSVINPAITLSHILEDTTYKQYMKLAMTMLEMCDGIYMLDGWQESRGANRELGFALAKDMLILYESEGVE